MKSFVAFITNAFILCLFLTFTIEPVCKTRFYHSRSHVFWNVAVVDVFVSQVDDIRAEAAVAAASESIASTQNLLASADTSTFKKRSKPSAKTSHSSTTKKSLSSSSSTTQSSSSSKPATNHHSWRLITDDMLSDLESIHQQIDDCRRDFAQRHKFVHRALAQLIAQSPNLPSAFQN